MCVRLSSSLCQIWGFPALSRFPFLYPTAFSSFGLFFFFLSCATKLLDKVDQKKKRKTLKQRLSSKFCQALHAQIRWMRKKRKEERKSAWMDFDRRNIPVPTDLAHVTSPATAATPLPPLLCHSATPPLPHSYPFAPAKPH